MAPQLFFEISAITSLPPSDPQWSSKSPASWFDFGHQPVTSSVGGRPAGHGVIAAFDHRHSRPRGDCEESNFVKLFEPEWPIAQRMATMADRSNNEEKRS